jgi:PAS domain S-box-containing protein
MHTSLRIKFLIFVTLLLVCAMGISTMASFINVSGSVKAILVQQMEYIASSTQKIVTSWVEEIKLNLHYSSTQSIYQMALEDSYIGRATRKNLDAVLKKQKRDYKYYERLNLVDVTGEIVSSSNDDAAEKKNVASQKFFRETLTGKTMITARPREPQETRNFFVISVPVMASDTVIGVLYAQIDLDYLNAMFVKPVKVGKTGYAYLIDENGLDLTHVDPTQMLKTNINKFDWGREMLSRGTGVITYTWKGVKKAAVFEKSKETGWLVGVGAPLAEVLEPARNVGLMNSAIVLVFIVIAIISIAFIYRTIVQEPINVLIAGIARFSAGNLEERITVRSGDEFGELAAAFNTMADDLKKTMVSMEIVQQERKRFQDVAENSGDWIWEADPQGRYTYSSPLVEKTLGYTVDEVVGKFFYDFFHPEDWDEHKRAALMDTPQKLPFRGLIVRHRTKDGRVVVIETTAIPVFDKNGGFTGYRGVDRDITERKKSEEAIKTAYEQLKAAQLQLVQSAKMASVGLLAGGVAHEINNPLTGILNNVQLVKIIAGQKKEFSIDDFNALLVVIEESAQRCTAITRSLLDFSRSSKGVFQKVSLNEIVTRVTVLVEHELALQNITIRKELSPELPALLGDSQLLQQVVFDLIANAKWAIQKKAEKSGGEISISTGSNPGERTVRLSVIDTGTGIADGDMEHIFEPFFTTKPVGEGTGLGLSIVYNIVKEHNGSITAENVLGKGVAFTITLPVAGV